MLHVLLEPELLCLEHLLYTHLYLALAVGLAVSSVSYNLVDMHFTSVVRLVLFLL